MKLVGATNGFIRFPFFVEGVTSGLISAGIASGHRLRCILCALPLVCRESVQPIPNVRRLPRAAGTGVVLHCRRLCRAVLCALRPWHCNQHPQASERITGDTGKSRYHGNIFRTEKSLSRCWLSVAVAMTMTLSTVMTPLAATTSVSDLRQKLQELQTKQDELDKQLKNAQSDKADAEAQKAQLEQQRELILSQINNLAQQIGDLDSEIVNKQDEIDQKQQEVDQKQAEYDQRWEDFKGRMKAMQRLNDGGSIALLSSATNLYQLLTFANTLEQIVAKDEQICQQLEDEHNELEQQKADLEQAKADLEATQADLESQRTALNGKTSELAQNISQTDASISAADAEIEANKAALIEANQGCR